MSIFLFIVHYEGVHILNCLINLKKSMKDLINIKSNDNKYEKIEKFIDLLLITNKSYYVYIKDFNRFTCNKTKNENKKHF